MEGRKGLNCSVVCLSFEQGKLLQSIVTQQFISSHKYSCQLEPSSYFHLCFMLWNSSSELGGHSYVQLQYCRLLCHLPCFIQFWRQWTDVGWDFSHKRSVIYEITSFPVTISAEFIKTKPQTIEIDFTSQWGEQRWYTALDLSILVIFAIVIFAAKHQCKTFLNLHILDIIFMKKYSLLLHPFRLF